MIKLDFWGEICYAIKGTQRVNHPPWGGMREFLIIREGEVMKRDYLSIADFSREEIEEVFALSAELKEKTKSERRPQLLSGKSIALIFHKPSLRTRVSFEVGLNQLGGRGLYITDQEIQLGRRESIYDAAKVLSRLVDGIMIRTFSHQDVEELAKWADVPVINGLTDLLHPCQILSDLFTIQEKKGKINGIKIAYLGDGNNVAHSWLNASTRIELDLRIGTAKGCEPDGGIFSRARNSKMAKVTLTYNPKEAVRGVDVIYTDVWASMGEKEKSAEKARLLRGFQINSELLSYADPNCLVMHCLPAERGREITDEVIDGPHSIVFDQAENRLHTQKALLVKLLVDPRNLKV